MIVVKFIKNKTEYREWDLLPRIALVSENKNFLGIAVGWLIFGIAMAIRKNEFTKRLKNL